MLRSLKEIEGYKVIAQDGDIGKVSDFYFDDDQWVIRYFVDKTGFGPFGRQLLVSPSSFKEPDWENKTFPVNLKKEQVKESPTVEADKVVSREREKELISHYGWPTYWGGEAGTLEGNYAGPVPVRDIVRDESMEVESGLRSTDEVTGYKIKTNDGKLGYVDDFLIEDDNWSIRYMIIDTKKILEGKKILIAPEWIKWISWHQKEVSVDMKKENIKACPDFELDETVSREYEEQLYNHYECNKYWEK